MALTAKEIMRAEQIIDTWFWQIDETRAYGYRGALNTITRFYESAPMSADIMRIVLEYLNSQEQMTGVSLNNKLVSLDGEWKAVAAFYRTAQGQNWAGTESSKVRVYQMIVKMGDEEGDGPYTIENGCKYKVSHEFFWNAPSEPVLPASSSGVQYQIGGLNRDKETGLYSYIIERRETVQQDIEFYDAAMTVFEKVEEAVHLGVKADVVDSTGEKASAAGGVTVERRVTKNPDCTSDIQNRRTTEQSVVGAVTTKRKTVKGTVTSVLDRNQAQAVTDGEPEKGETYRSEKTPGGLHNNTVETFTHDEGEKTLVEQCQKTVFEHTDETLKSKAALDEGETAEVDEAAGGVIKSKTIRETEEGIEISERTTTEVAVADAVVVKRKTARGTMVSTTDRNQETPKATVEADVPQGETWRSEKTPGGLYNNTVEKLETVEGAFVEQCQKTAFEHVDEKVTATKKKPETVEVDEAAGGVIKAKTVRATDEGYDVSERTTTEVAVAGAVVVKRKTLRGTLTSTTDRNQVAASTAEPGVGETIRSEKTPGGRYNNTVEKMTASQAGNLRKECRASSLSHTDISVDLAAPGTQLTEQTADVNVEKQSAVVYNEDGTTEVQTVTTTHEPSSKVKTWSDENYDYVYCSYVNQPEPLMPTSGEVCGASFAQNAHGSYNGSYTSRTGKVSQTTNTTLQWHKGPVPISSKYYYYNKKGDYCYREFTAEAEYFYGRTNAVIDKVAGGENCAHVGWRSTWNGNHEYAQGVKYTGVECGEEVVIEEASGSSGE